MALFLRLLSLSLLLVSLSALGCSSQLSEEETPVIATDEEETEPVGNDPENP